MSPRTRQRPSNRRCLVSDIGIKSGRTVNSNERKTVLWVGCQSKVNQNENIVFVVCWARW